MPATVSVVRVQDGTEGGADGLFRFTRTGDTTDPLVIQVGVGGTAAWDDDYTGFSDPTSVVIDSGETTVDLLVDVEDDSVAEPTETVVVTILEDAAYTIDSPSSATVNIFDNETPVVSIAATDTFEGAATGGFTLTRIGDLSGSLKVSYSVDGSATAKTDYDELSGSVTFAAGADRVEVPVVALGDNTADDGETIIATIATTEFYEADGTAYTATVTIADQPLTVSVVRLNDGTEGGGSGTFRFTRSGDISQSLTVSYTVGGTATSGSDFESMSGSVTFDANDDEVDVTVTVSNDGDAEPTETVRVTLDMSSSYLLGIESDSLFIHDDDTTKVYWVSSALTGYSTDWEYGPNWSTGSVPTAGQDVYFSGSHSSVGCTNVGAGLSGNLAGLHLVNGYLGTATLATALSVGTYEQTAGTLDQPDSGRNLTVTAALLWSGGTLNATDSGADVTLTGSNAVGFIDPPDTGSMGTSSTLKLLSGAVATFLPGALEFAAGNGMYIADSIVLVHVRGYATVQWIGTTGRQVEVAANSTFKVVNGIPIFPGAC